MEKLKCERERERDLHYTQCNSTRVLPFFKPQIFIKYNCKKKTPLSILSLNTYLIIASLFSLSFINYVQLFLIYHCTPLVQWSLHKYKCLWGVRGGGGGKGHIYTQIRLKQNFYHVLRNIYIYIPNFQYKREKDTKNYAQQLVGHSHPLLITIESQTKSCNFIR